MNEPYIAVQIPMMPKDTNRHGTIFGGVLLANIDLAGAIAAQRELQLRGGNPKAAFVTVALNKVEFKKPVLVGDVVRFETSIVRIGRTSMTVRVDVHVERGTGSIHVTEASFIRQASTQDLPTSAPFPGFASNRTNNATLTIGFLSFRHCCGLAM